jgi:hypothetical protein
MHTLTDMWDEQVYVGDTVIASRPAGAGTTMLQYCRVTKVNEKSVSLISLQRDGEAAVPRYSWESGKFTLQKNSGNRCNKIVRHRE